MPNLADLVAETRRFGIRQFIFRPGGTAEGNIYTSFSSLYSALSAAPGIKVLVFDKTFGTITIPAGVYNFANTIWSGGGVLGNVAAGEVNPLVTLSNGVIITNLTVIEGLRIYQPAGVATPISISAGVNALFLKQADLVSQAGAQPLIQVSGSATLILRMTIASLSGGAAIVNLVGTSVLQSIMSEESGISQDMVSGVVGTTFSPQGDASSGAHPTQTGFLGTRSADSLTARADRVNMPNAGQIVGTGALSQSLLQLDSAVATGGKFNSQDSAGAGVTINPATGSQQYLNLSHAGATISVNQPGAAMVLKIYIEKVGVGTIAGWNFAPASVVWQTPAGNETTLVGGGDVLYIRLVYKGGGLWKGWATPKS